MHADPSQCRWIAANRCLPAGGAPERRRRLARSVLGTAARIASGHRRELRRLGLEVAIAKRINSRYEPGERSDAWLKVIPARAGVRHRRFTPDGDRVDALVAGYYDKKRPMAAGKVRARLTPLVARTAFTEWTGNGSAKEIDVRGRLYGRRVT
jgi:hypothetical protein